MGIQRNSEAGGDIWEAEPQDAIYENPPLPHFVYKQAFLNPGSRIMT